jgi:Uma2 family endonuclease
MSIVEEELVVAVSEIESGGLALVPEMAGTLMTPEEFDSADDWEEGYVFELIHGVLVVSPPPDISERGPNDLLAQLLRNYADQQPQRTGFLYTLPEHTVHTSISRRRADRVIWVGLGRYPHQREDFPTIIVEFVSKDRRDRKRDYEEKRDEYLEAGVKEYWVIDRFHKRLTVFRKSGDATTEQVVSATEAYATPLLPGFQLFIDRLFSEAEKLESPGAAG